MQHGLDKPPLRSITALFFEIFAVYLLFDEDLPVCPLSIPG